MDGKTSLGLVWLIWLVWYRHEKCRLVRVIVRIGVFWQNYLTVRQKMQSPPTNTQGGVVL